MYKNKYNLRRDLGDQRDHSYTASTTSFPSSVNLGSYFPRVFDQGNLGSCTGNMWSGLYGLQRGILGEHKYHPSRLFIYWNERELEGTVNYDSGAQIRTGAKVLAKIGACRERHWDYQHDFRTKPTDKCFQEATNWIVPEYQKVDNTDVNNLKSCLVENQGVGFGFTVYESFESDAVAETGIVPMPKSNEKVLGGHAIYIHGYDDDTQLFKCRNSWGQDFGDNGDVYMPYAYLTNPQLASDFWIIKVK